MSDKSPGSVPAAKAILAGSPGHQGESGDFMPMPSTCKALEEKLTHA